MAWHWTNTVIFATEKCALLDCGSKSRQGSYIILGEACVGLMCVEEVSQKVGPMSRCATFGKKVDTRNLR